jgi:hypothetical protein
VAALVADTLNLNRGLGGSGGLHRQLRVGKSSVQYTTFSTGDSAGSGPNHGESSARCDIFDSQLGTGLNLDSRNERKYSSFGCHYSSCKLTRAC